MIQAEQSWLLPVVDALARAFPDRSELSLISEAEITGGWETTIFRIEIGYRLRGERMREALIARFYLGLEPQFQAARDFALMRSLAALGFPVPRVDLAVVESQEAQFPFLVMEEIPGPTYRDLIDDCSEEEGLSHIRGMTEPLARLHAIALEDLFDIRSLLPGLANTKERYIPSLLADLRQKAASHDLTEFEFHLAWLEAQPEASHPAQLGLLHNDFHQGNLLCREEGGEAVVIDWTFADVGDIRLDLAWLGLMLAVQKGAVFREQMLSEYEALCGERVQSLSYFEALKFTDRMLTIVTWLDASVEIPVPKITREAIRGEYKIHVLNVYQRLVEITGLRLRSIDEL